MSLCQRSFPYSSIKGRLLHSGGVDSCANECKGKGETHLESISRIDVSDGGYSEGTDEARVSAD